MLYITQLCVGDSFDVVGPINIKSTWPQVDKLFINLGLLWQCGRLLSLDDFAQNTSQLNQR